MHQIAVKVKREVRIESAVPFKAADEQFYKFIYSNESGNGVWTLQPCAADGSHDLTLGIVIDPRVMGVAGVLAEYMAEASKALTLR